MILSPTLAQRIRAMLLTSIDQTGSEVIDSRFIKPIFSNETFMRRWASSWNLDLRFFSQKDINEKVGNETLPITWVEFSHKEKDNILLIEGEDKEL